MNGLPVFASPWWLAALALLPLVALARRRWRGRGVLTLSRLPPARAAFGRLRLELPFACRLAALALLVVALARPQLGTRHEESSLEGIDIVMALDVSGSMGAEDFQPRNRLEVAKKVLADFVAGRHSDRLGLTLFSGAAVTRAPLTADRRMLARILEEVELHGLPDGTAVGLALASAAARLAASPAASRVIVLVTDGVHNAGAIGPAEAAAICRGLGIRVYTVGVGREGRVPVPLPVTNPATGEIESRRVLLDVEVDRALLEAIAVETGGRFFSAADPGALARIFAEIDRLERAPLAVRRLVHFEERFAAAAWGALALLLAPLVTTAMGWTGEP